MSTYQVISVCLSVLIVILTSLNIFILVNLNKVKRTSEVLQAQENSDSLSDVKELSSYEIERIKREEEFDKRINRLKSEMANQQNTERKGVIAEELHPLVRNLPHNAINVGYEGLPDVEFAE